MTDTPRLYCTAFIFSQHTRDDAFTALDDAIAAVAEASEGFAGKENWVSRDGARLNSSYYWHSMEALQAFSRHPVHLEAKRRYKDWYDGFHIVISEVTHAYGDGTMAHLTSGAGLSRKRP